MRIYNVPFTAIDEICAIACICGHTMTEGQFRTGLFSITKIKLMRDPLKYVFTALRYDSSTVTICYDRA